MIPLILGMLLGTPTTAIPPMSEIAHSIRVDHAAGPVDADYRMRIDVSHNQVGSAGPGGRPSTLRCRWEADLLLDRSARHSAGTVLQRSLRRDAVASGSRPGWCTANREAIARDVARATSDVQGEVRALAQQDAEGLRAELDRLGNDRNG